MKETAPHEPPGPQFSLGTLLLVMTLLSVALGLYQAAPWLGIGFFTLAVPALIRTGRWSQKQSSLGRPTTMQSKFLDFSVSLWLMVMIAVSAAIAFYATCWVGFLAYAYSMMGLRRPGGIGLAVEALFAGIIVGAIAGLYCAYRVTRHVWSLGRQKPSAAANLCSLCKSDLTPDGDCPICRERNVDDSLTGKSV